MIVKEHFNAEGHKGFRKGTQRKAFLCVPLRMPQRPLRLEKIVSKARITEF